MFRLVVIVVFAFSCAVCSDRPIEKILTTDNGMTFGTWRDPDFCPYGSFAYAFKVKFEKKQDGDDSALNRIQLKCAPGRQSDRSKFGGRIESGYGPYGDWKSLRTCDKRTSLAGFALQVEKDQGSRDDSAANGIKMACRYWDVYVAIREMHEDGLWGQYGGWRYCPIGTAICGIQTRVEKTRGCNRDQSTLNDAKFFCCKE